jgi:hypothetical protein
LLYEETFEHATKLIELITRCIVQLMELHMELAAAVRFIANNPIPRELISNRFELSRLPLHSSLAGQSFIFSSYLFVFSQAACQL